MEHPDITQCERTGDNRTQEQRDFAPEKRPMGIGLHQPCHQCNGELLRGKVYDEGIEKHFCDVECQLTFYQEEYDRLITRVNRMNKNLANKCIEKLESETLLEATKLQLKEARCEIRVIWDSARFAMVQTGQGIVQGLK